MALTKVSAAMFSTAASASDLNLDDGTLFVDASENKVAIGNTAPAEALDITGNLTLRARGYLKLQDDAGGQFVAIRAPATVSSSVTYTFPAADGSSGQSLTTDGSGTLSWSAAAPTAGTGVTVSGSQVSIGQAVATSSNVQFNSVKTTLIEYTDGDDAITIADGGHITAAGNVTVTGNLTVNGSTVTNSATNTTIEDLLIELGTGTSGTPSSDAGLILERGSSDNIFIGWDESADVFTVGTGSFTGASTGNLTHTAANAVFGTITGTSITGNSLTIDTATLVVDASNNRVGIGNASPDVSLDIGSYTDAVHVPVGTTAQRPGSPAAGYFRYNSTTSQFEGYTSSWGAIGGGSTTLNTDLFTGNGSTVDFTISQAIDNENKLIVFVDGVYQNPDAYSMPANTTLRFSAAPANGRKIAVYSVAGVVSGTNLNIDSFTGDGSDTTFTLSITPVNENNTLVYVGGVYQQKSTYSVSGTTLTFSTAPPSGASIEVATMNQTNINVPVDDTITTAKIVNDAVTADKIVDNIALPGNITTTGTLAPTGVLTANAGVVVDNITIDGTEIDLSSGDLIVDVAGDITLDADGGDINFKDGGTLFGQISNSSGLYLVSNVVDAPMYLRGNDGSSYVNALTIDFQNGGNVTFLSDVTAGGKFIASTTSTTDSVLRLTDGGVADYDFTFPDTGTIQLGVNTSSNKELKLLNAGSGMFGLNVEGHILPSANNTYSLGSSGARYYQVWAATNMVSPTYIATGNVTTGGYQLTDTSGNSKPAITSDANNWTIIRPLASGSDVAINNYANSANLVTFTDEGNVGIGLTSPTSYYNRTLHIYGGSNCAIKLSNSDTGSGNGDGIDIALDDTEELRIINRVSDGSIALFPKAGTRVLTTNGTRDVQIGGTSTSDYRDGRPHTGLQSGGQFRVLGLGNGHVSFDAVTSNSSYLTINSGESRLNNDAGYIAFGHNTNHSVPAFVAYIMHRSRGATNQGYFDFYTRNTSGTAIHTARMDGDASSGLYSRDGGVHSLSDGRLKKNIQDLTYSMEEFKALKPRTFEWINTGDHPEGIQNGFIAQELPELHKSNYVVGEKTGPLDEDIDPDYALVKDENGVGNAFGASLGSNDAMYVSIIQQLIARIEALESK